MPVQILESQVLLVLLGLGIGLLLALAYGLLWKARYSQHIRQDAVRRSQATIAGQVHEQLLPYLPEFGYNPKDARFLGSPVDLIVFHGLDAGQLQRIVFIEVKTGKATMTGRERQIRDAVRGGKVSWEELRVGPQTSRDAG
jgi:predicted Holliday junction resolvase-like endonuclease